VWSLGFMGWGWIVGSRNLITPRQVAASTRLEMSRKFSKE